MLGALLVPAVSAPAVSRANGRYDSSLDAAAIDSTFQWVPLISSVSRETGVPRQVLRAVVIAESGGDEWAYSPDPVAFGLMLVTKDVEARSQLPNRGDIFDPETNIRLGAEVLASAYARWGSWDLAIMHWHDIRHPHLPPTTGGYSWESPSYQYLQRVNHALHYLHFEPESPDFAGRALAHGLTAVGMPYLAGGQSMEDGGFDCSGLVMWAYRFAGIALPAGTGPQWDATIRISEEEARPGDIVFFAGTWDGGISHAGLYMGDGMMLHSPTEGKVVEIIPIHGPYWGEHLAGFGRVP